MGAKCPTNGVKLMPWKTVGTRTLTLTVTAPGGGTPSPPSPQPPEEKKSTPALLLLGAAIGLALLSRSGEKG